MASGIRVYGERNRSRAACPSRGAHGIWQLARRGTDDYRLDSAHRVAGHHCHNAEIRSGTECLWQGRAVVSQQLQGGMEERFLQAAVDCLHAEIHGRSLGVGVVHAVCGARCWSEREHHRNSAGPLRVAASNLAGVGQAVRADR